MISTKLLMTGGAGFLGQHLILALKTSNLDNISLTVIDKNKNPIPFIDFNQIKNLKIHYNVDITNYEEIKDYFKNIDIVFHLAGVISFYKKDKNRLFQINVQGTENVLKAAFINNVKRVIHVSSVTGIGYSNDPTILADEKFEFNWDKARSKYYMLSKHQSELVAQYYINKGLSVVIINPGLMYGPGDHFNTIRLIKSIYHDKLSVIMPGGTNVVDVRDVAKGLIKFIKNGRAGERYILGGHNYTFKEIFFTIAQVLEKTEYKPKIIPFKYKYLLIPAANFLETVLPFRLPVTYDMVDSGFKYRYFSSIKAKRETGYKISIPFAKTIKDTVEWYQQMKIL